MLLYRLDDKSSEIGNMLKKKDISFYHAKQLYQSFVKTYPFLKSVKSKVDEIKVSFFKAMIFKLYQTLLQDSKTMFCF